MFAYISFISVCAILVYIQNSHGLVFDEPMDCILSPWTEWAAVVGNDDLTRNRVILRHPFNGGNPCNGDMSDTKSLGIPSLNQTATSVIHNFIRPHGIENNDQRKKRGGQLQAQLIGEWRDLLIIIDTSRSIGHAGFDKAKASLASLLGAMCPAPDPFKTGTNQAALVKFSNNAYTVFDFDDYQTTHDIQAAIIATPYVEGGTCTAKAFAKHIELFRNATHGARDRYDVSKEILILTDGESNCGGDAFIASIKAQSTAVVYGLVIGSPSSAGRAEIESYVSGPLNKHLFAVANLRDLESLFQKVKSMMKSSNMKCAPFKVGP